MFWDYEPAELIADAAVHALGVAFAVAGAVVLFVVARDAGHVELAALGVYALGLLLMLSCSALYNIWPVSPAKWVLRRFDHSAIYVMIAGTYTPFIAQLKASAASIALLAGMWAIVAAGTAVKLVLPGRFDRLSIVLFLGLGWSGLLVWDAVIEALPATTLLLLAAGGALYCIGLVFHLWARLLFQNAIWHGFVLAAAVCHYGAVLNLLIA